MGEGEKRTRCVMVRFSDSEYAVVREKAERFGSPVASYCRAAALAGRVVVVKARRVELDSVVLFNLHRIGTNLNQLVKMLRQTKPKHIAYDVVVQCLTLVNEVKNLYTEILRAMQ